MCVFFVANGVGGKVATGHQCNWGSRVSKGVRLCLECRLGWEWSFEVSVWLVCDLEVVNLGMQSWLSTSFGL